MKIKWIGGKRYVPRVGILQEGDVRNLPEDIARGFVKQGLAEKLIKKHKKQKLTKE